MRPRSSERAVMIEQAILHGLDMARQTFALHCEVAQRFASWLGFSEGTQAALAHVFERWDGHGFPGVTRRRVASKRRSHIRPASPTGIGP